MKSITNRYLIILLSLLAASSCDIAEFGGSREKGMGTLSVDVKTSDVITKAATGDALTDNAIVNIYMADFSGLVRTYRYADAPESIYLPADSYRVDVVAGEAAKDNPEKASWTSRSYKGSKEFTVTAGQNTSVQVEAGVSNAVTAISFDSSVSSSFYSSYSLRIGVSDEDAVLTYTRSDSGRQGYFIIDGLDEPSFTWTFTGTLLKDGSAVTKTGKIEGIESGKLYQMSLRYTIKDGEMSFDLYVDYSLDIIDDTIIFEPLSTGLSNSSPYEIWAGHATIHADIDETEYPDPSKIRFAYRTGSGSWIEVPAARASEGVYNARLTGLAPESEYTYKLVIDGEDIGDTKTFITEPAPAVPNGSFDNVSLAASNASYYVFYDPASSDPASQQMWWGSGNGTADVSGSASMGLVITVPDNSDKVDGPRSVCCQSKSIIGMLAAGNLFSGKFMGLVGTSGGRVAFGRPWTARPTALKCWVKYSTGTVNIIKSVPDGVSVSRSDYDMGMVRIALGTWNYRTYGGSKDSPVLVNTTDASTIIDYTKDPSTIAFGEAKFIGDASNSTNVWREITIPIEYYDETSYPTHIIISCASSYYGDYFTGCDSSKLWIDKMELVYE